MGNVQVPRKDLVSVTGKKLDKLFNKHVIDMRLPGIILTEDSWIRQASRSLAESIGMDQFGSSKNLFMYLPEEQDFGVSIATVRYLDMLGVNRQSATGNFYLILKNPATDERRWFLVENIQIFYVKDEKTFVYMAAGVIVRSDQALLRHGEKARLQKEELELLETEIRDARKRVSGRDGLRAEIETTEANLTEANEENAAILEKMKSLAEALRAKEDEILERHETLLRELERTRESLLHRDSADWYAKQLTKLEEMEREYKTMLQTIESLEKDILTAQRQHREAVQMYESVRNSKHFARENSFLAKLNRTYNEKYRLLSDAIESKFLASAKTEKAMTRLLQKQSMLAAKIRSRILHYCQDGAFLDDVRDLLGEEVVSRKAKKRGAPRKEVKRSTLYAPADNQPKSGQNPFGSPGRPFSRLRSYSLFRSADSPFSPNSANRDGATEVTASLSNNPSGPSSDVTALRSNRTLTAVFHQFLIPRGLNSLLLKYCDEPYADDVPQFKKFYVYPLNSFFVSLAVDTAKLGKLLGSREFRLFSKSAGYPKSARVSIARSGTMVHTKAHVSIVATADPEQSSDLNLVERILLSDISRYCSGDVAINDEIDIRGWGSIPNTKARRIRDMNKVAQICALYVNFFVDRLSADYSGISILGSGPGVSLALNKDKLMKGHLNISFLKIHEPVEYLLANFRKLTLLDLSVLKEMPDEERILFWINVFNLSVYYLLFRFDYLPTEKTSKAFKKIYINVGGIYVNLRSMYRILGVHSPSTTQENSPPVKGIPFEDISVRNNPFKGETILCLSSFEHDYVGIYLPIDRQGIEILKEHARIRCNETVWMERGSAKVLNLSPIFKDIERVEERFDDFLAKYVNEEYIEWRFAATALWKNVMGIYTPLTAKRK